MTDLLDRVKTTLAHGGWAKLDDIIQAMGENPEDKSVPRQVRSVISASCGQIISNSTDGYRLIATATTEEIRHAVNDLRSRASKLESRARLIEDAARNRPVDQPAPTMPTGTTTMPPEPPKPQPEPDWTNLIPPSESDLWRN